MKATSWLRLPSHRINKTWWQNQFSHMKRGTTMPSWKHDLPQICGPCRTMWGPAEPPWTLKLSNLRPAAVLFSRLEISQVTVSWSPLCPSFSNSRVSEILGLKLCMLLQKLQIDNLRFATWATTTDLLQICSGALVTNSIYSHHGSASFIHLKMALWEECKGSRVQCITVAFSVFKSKPQGNEARDWSAVSGSDFWLVST
jgi:hypothetical protein